MELIVTTPEILKKIIDESIANYFNNNLKSKDADSLNNDPPITTKKLCKHLGVTEPTILRWRKKGKIPFFLIGTAVRFNLQEVITALKK